MKLLSKIGFSLFSLAGFAPSIADSHAFESQSLKQRPDNEQGKILVFVGKTRVPAARQSDMQEST